MINGKKRLSYKILSAVVAILCVISAFSLGFSSWGVAYSDSVEANMQLVANGVTGDFVQFKNVHLTNEKIRFDANEDRNGNVTIGSDGGKEQLNCEIVGTLGKYSTFKEINASISADSHYEQTWNKLYQKGYFDIPRFITLSRYSSSEDNGNDVTTYWTSNYDSKADERSFCIRSTFTWGKFFNYKNPCDFFDSNDSNGTKKGNEYNFQEKKNILKELKTLDGSKFIVTLSSKPLEYEVYVTYDGSLTNIYQLNDAIKSGVIYFPEEPKDTDSPIGGTFKGWKLSNGEKEDSTLYAASSSTSIDLDLFDGTNKIYIIANWRYDIDIPVQTMTASLSNSDGESVGEGTSGEEKNISLDTASATLKLVVKFKPANATNQNISVDKSTDSSDLTVTVSEDKSTITLTNNDSSNSHKATIVISSISNESLKATFVISVDQKSSCLLPTAKILMADGTYKQAGLIKSGDMVMSFNHETGELEPNMIIINDEIDRETNIYNVVHLMFSNGKSTDFIYEHGYFDLTLNKYVYLHENDSTNYIGHEFVFVDGNKINKAKLVKSSITQMFTSLASPATANHLNIIVDDMLSMAGGLSGLFNIFEYDSDTLAFNKEKMQNDINQYGLLDYSYFEKYFSKEIYDLLPCKYLGVSIGKGLITWEKIEEYINKFGTKLLK